MSVLRVSQLRVHVLLREAPNGASRHRGSSLCFCPKGLGPNSGSLGELSWGCLCMPQEAQKQDLVSRDGPCRAGSALIGSGSLGVGSTCLLSAGCS